METSAYTQKAFVNREEAGYRPPAGKEKLERDIEVFARSVLEMIRQRPGIREAELRGMYTKRERMFVDQALLRLKSASCIGWKEDGGPIRLYPRKEYSRSSF